MCRGWAVGGEGRADEACLGAGYEIGYLGGRGVVTAELTKHHAHLCSNCHRLRCLQNTFTCAHALKSSIEDMHELRPLCG